VIIFGVPAVAEPSREELAALVGQLRAELALAQAEIVELRARLGQTSKNSSRPVCHEREGGGRM